MYTVSKHSLYGFLCLTIHKRYFPAKALIYGEERAVYWGHDTFLDEEYRGDFGAMLMLEVQKIPHFGMGFSDVNQKIQRMLKSAFFKGIIFYGAPNIFFIRSLLTSDEKEYSPHWLYSSKTEEYDSCYFVVRPILFKKIPALSIVDFRYDLAQPAQFSLILKAARKIAKLNKIGLVLYVNNLGDVKPLMKFANSLSVLSLSPLLLRKTQAIDYIATSSYHLPSSATSVATEADSDFDFSRKEIG